MARSREVNKPSIAALTPESITFILDILSSAEEVITLRDLLTNLVDRLVMAFGPRLIVGLLATTDDACWRKHVHDEPSLAGLIAELEEQSSRIAFAVVAGHHGTSSPSPNDTFRSLRSLDEGACMLIHDVIHDQSAILVLECPGLSPGELARLQVALQTLTTALFSRHQSAHLQRGRIERVATLSTILADIASDLDIDLLLANIVERARSLIGTDSAYLAEVDEPTGTVSMRVTVGIADPGYKQSSVEIGKGMAGAVAAAEHVMSTRDYLVDDRFIHTRETDANVTREGIRGVILAPMRARERVTGVLGVANHHATDFAEDDVRLAKSLADGAAIALENARLYSAQSQLVDQLRTLNELTSSQNERLRRSMLIHDQLAEIVLQGHGIEVIARRLSTLFSNPVIVLSQFFSVLVASEISQVAAALIATCLEAGAVESRLTSGRRDKASERRPIRLDRDSVHCLETPIILTPVMAGHDLLGYVVIVEARRDFDDVDIQALVQAATVVALEFTRSRVAFEVETRLRGDLVHDLVLGAFHPDTIIGRAARLGHDLTLPQTIVATAIDSLPESAKALTDAQHVDLSQRLERTLQTSFRRRSVMAQTSLMGDVIVSLVTTQSESKHLRTRSNELIRQIHTEIARSVAPTMISMGVSQPGHDAFSLARAYQEAMQALRTGQHRGEQGSVTEFERLGIDRFLLQLPDSTAIDDYVNFMLGPLLTYDGQHGTQLITTLGAFIDAGGNQRETAKALGVHVNTLQYRLRRIEEIGNLRLNDSEIRLNLHLALHARRMRLTIQPVKSS